MEKLAHRLVEIAMKTADNPALEDRCLKALSKLGSLHLPNHFFHSVGNRMLSLKSDPRRKPVIREYADRVLTHWMRQLYSRAPEKPTPTIDLKPQSTTKNPKSGGQHPTSGNTDKSPKSKESSVEKLALELVDIAIETAATVSQPLDDRCIKALLKLSTLDLKSEFIVSSDIANIVDYNLNSDSRIKPLIRGYAARLLARWTARLPKPACDLKPRRKTKHKKLRINVGRQAAVC